MAVFTLPNSVRLILSCLSVVFITGCTDNNSRDVVIAETQNLSEIKSVGTVYHAENGNRVVKGLGDLPNITPIDITLPADVRWIAATADESQSIWVAMLESGSIKAYKIQNQSAVEISITPSQVTTPMPPTLVLENDGSVKLANVFGDGSVYTSPVIINKTTGDLVYIATNGDVVLKTARGEQRLTINALPYARLLMDEKKRILVLTDPTSRYDHAGVLGGSVQHASSITIIDVDTNTNTFAVSNTITIDSPDVIEGNALIWADVDNDGDNEIVTTVSNTNGARIVVYNEDGSLYGESTAIGINQRWRHQIAVAPFKSSLETSLVSVYIPHLGPEIEYFRLDDASMTITNKTPNQTSIYTSHLFTGINIDMGITGDFDGDGKLELLLIDHASRSGGPNHPSKIGAFEYDENGITLDWNLNLTALITSNVAAVTLSNNTIAYGVGQGQTLRIWHP